MFSTSKCHSQMVETLDWRCGGCGLKSWHLITFFKQENINLHFPLYAKMLTWYLVGRHLLNAVSTRKAGIILEHFKHCEMCAWQN